MSNPVTNPDPESLSYKVAKLEVIQDAIVRVVGQKLVQDQIDTMSKLRVDESNRAIFDRSKAHWSAMVDKGLAVKVETLGPKTYFFSTKPDGGGECGPVHEALVGRKVGETVELSPGAPVTITEAYEASTVVPKVAAIQPHQALKKYRKGR